MSVLNRGLSRTATAVLAIVIIVVAGVSVLIYSSLSPSTSTSTTSTSSAVAPNTLAIDDWQWPIEDLNELTAFTELMWPNWLQYTVYQPLVSVNGTAEFQDGTVQYLPGLAANWTVSPDATVYTFNLRQNVHFSNGDPFNAYQVWAEMYGFYYLSANSSTWLISYDIFNMSAVNFGPSTISLLNQSGLINPSQDASKIMMDTSWPIYVTGPYQIVFHLKAPFLWLPGLLVTYDGLMFDTNWVLQHGGFGTATAINTYFNQHPIPGTGPYVVSNMQVQQYVQFAQDPNYWGRSLTQAEINGDPYFDPGHVQNVIVYFKGDDVSRYADLASGKVQIANIQFPNWKLVTSNPQYSYLTLPFNGASAIILGLNTQLYPTNITDVRQAIVHAINYTALYEKAYIGEKPYVGPSYPLWRDFYNLGNFLPYQTNLTLARQYLSQAKIANMPVFTLKIIPFCEVCSAGAQEIQADLSAIGITVNVEVVSNSQFYTPYGAYSYELSNAQEIGQLAFFDGGSAFATAGIAPSDAWVSFLSCSSLYGNYAVYCNPTVQRAVDAFTSSSNVTYITSLVQTAQTQVYNDAPYAWIGEMGLWGSAGGSLVWQKGVISGFLVDPAFSGQNTIPIFNTVTFG